MQTSADTPGAPIASALLAAALCLLPSAAMSAGPLYKDPSSPVAARVEDLLGRMTPEEKLGQLQQLDGHADGAFRPEHLELARRGALGSTLNVRGAARVNELQRAAVEGSRLKIPILFGFDVIHGYRTIFPMPLAEAASWEPSLAEKAAQIAAAEAYAAGVRWTFAPMVDIARDPRWGRIMEGSGEDPYLGSVFAAARVRGFQGTDYSEPGRLAACAKHWAAYGAAGLVMPLLLLANAVLTLLIKSFKGWDFNRFIWTDSALVWPIAAGILMFWLIGKLFWRMKKGGYAAALAISLGVSLVLIYAAVTGMSRGDSDLYRLGSVITGLIWHLSWMSYFLRLDIRGLFLTRETLA